MVQEQVREPGPAEFAEVAPQSETNVPMTGPQSGSRSCIQHSKQLSNSECSFCRSEEHTSELQSLTNLVCRLLLAKKNNVATSTTSFLFFFNDTATTEIYTLSLHDALPI